MEDGTTYYTLAGGLYIYATGEYIREATEAEIERSDNGDRDTGAFWMSDADFARGTKKLEKEEEECEKIIKTIVTEIAFREDDAREIRRLRVCASDPAEPGEECDQCLMEKEEGECSK